MLLGASMCPYVALYYRHNERQRCIIEKRVFWGLRKRNRIIQAYTVVNGQTSERSWHTLLTTITISQTKAYFLRPVVVLALGPCPAAALMSGQGVLATVLLVYCRSNRHGMPGLNTPLAALHLFP